MNQRGFHATAIDRNGDKGIPDLVQLLPPGEFSGRDGRGPYRADTATILQAFAKWGMPLAIDYDHQGLFVKDNGAPAPAAGWVQRLISNAQGLWGKVDWTAKAREMIANGEYRYLSPVFDYGPGGSIMRIIGAGLTNSPNLYLTAFNSRLQGTPANTNPLIRDAMRRADNAMVGVSFADPGAPRMGGTTNPLIADALRRST